MNNETGYNGWANYQTWLVGLWFGNDQGLCGRWDSAAREIVLDVSETWEPGYGWESHEREAAKRLAEEMEEWVGEEVDSLFVGTAGMLRDLLNSALIRVNWDEVVKSWLDEVEKPEGWVREKEGE